MNELKIQYKNETGKNADLGSEFYELPEGFDPETVSQEIAQEVNKIKNDIQTILDELPSLEYINWLEEKAVRLEKSLRLKIGS